MLTVLVNITEKSGNLRSDLRKDVLRAVSNLRKEFAKLRSEVEDTNKVIVGWEMKAEETESILKALQCGVGGNCRGDKEATSVGLQVTPKGGDWNEVPSAGKTRKRYSDVVADRQGTVSYDDKMYKFVKSKHNQSAEYIRTLLNS
jgi:hypothetical protein